MAIYTRSGSILRNAGGGIWTNASSGPPASDPYEWYPTLDLADIPFHNGSGGWGAQRAIVAPTAPTVSSFVNVDEAYVNALVGPDRTNYNPTSGTRFTLTGNVTGDWTIGGTITDIEIVIPSGISITGRLTISGTVNRLRIRGSTVGSHSGGTISHGINVNGSGASNLFDIIFDGIKLGSTDNAFEYNIVQSDVVTRWAIVNCQLKAARSTFIGEAVDCVWAGNSMLAGVYSSGQVVGGVDGGAQWGLRHGGRGPIVLFDNDIRGRRFHRFRAATESQPQAGMLIWVGSNTIVAEQEGKFTQTGILSGSTHWLGSWCVNNNLHGYGGIAFDWERSIYGRITGNNCFHDTLDAGYLAGRESATESYFTGLSISSDHDYATGNTFNGWSRPSSWGGAGDPSGISLPGGSILNSTLHDLDLAGILP